MNEGLKVWYSVGPLVLGLVWAGLVGISKAVCSKVGLFPVIGGSLLAREGTAKASLLTTEIRFLLWRFEHRAMGGVSLHRGGEMGLERGEKLVVSGPVFKRLGGES